MAIHSRGQNVFSLSHIEGITLGAGMEVDEVAGGAGGMGVDKISTIYVYYITYPLTLITAPATILNLSINLFCFLDTAIVRVSVNK